MGLPGGIMGGPPGCHPGGGGPPRPPKFGGGPAAAQGGRIGPPRASPGRKPGPPGPGTKPPLGSVICLFGAGPASEPPLSCSRLARVPACEGSIDGYSGPPLPAPGGRLKKLGPGGAPKGTAPPICIATCVQETFFNACISFWKPKSFNHSTVS